MNKKELFEKLKNGTKIKITEKCHNELMNKHNNLMERIKNTVNKFNKENNINITYNIDTEKNIVHFSNGQFIFLNSLNMLITFKKINDIKVRSNDIIINNIYCNKKDIVIINNNTFKNKSGIEFELI